METVQYCATHSVSVSSSSLRQQHLAGGTKLEGVSITTATAAAVVASVAPVTATLNSVKLARTTKEIKKSATRAGKIIVVEGKVIERRRAFNSHLRKLNNNKKNNSLSISLTITNNIKPHCFGIAFGSTRSIKRETEENY